MFRLLFVAAVARSLTGLLVMIGIGLAVPSATAVAEPSWCEEAGRTLQQCEQNFLHDLVANGVPTRAAWADLEAGHLVVDQMSRHPDQANFDHITGDLILDDPRKTPQQAQVFIKLALLHLGARWLTDPSG